MPMYNCSDELYNLFQAEYRQVARLTVSSQSGLLTKVYTEADIAQNGLTIDRATYSGNKLEAGACIASELRVTFRMGVNYTFADAVNWFYDRKVTVEIGVKKWDAYQWENAQVQYIPYGTYNVVAISDVIDGVFTITAYDNLIKFDKQVDPAEYTVPITVSNLITRTCEICGVSLGSIARASGSPPPNFSYEVQSIPAGYTYRQIIQWCTFLIGSEFSYQDHEGKLRFYPYVYDPTATHNHKWLKLVKSNEYKRALYSNVNYEVTGLVYYNSEGEDIGYQVNPGGFNNRKKHPIVYSGCMLYDESVQDDVMQKIGSALYTIYLPYDATIITNPVIDIGDSVDFYKVPGYLETNYLAGHIGYLQFTLNQPTKIGCKVELVSNMYYSSYDSGGPMAIPDSSNITVDNDNTNITVEIPDE